MASDERVDAFPTRPLEGEWPYLRIDAPCLKVRQGGRILSVAVTIAVGVNTDGRREGLGMAIGPSGAFGYASPFWTDVLRDLVRRDLSGMKLVIRSAEEEQPGALFLRPTARELEPDAPP